MSCLWASWKQLEGGKQDAGLDGLFGLVQQGTVMFRSTCGFSDGKTEKDLSHYIYLDELLSVRADSTGAKQINVLDRKQLRREKHAVTVTALESIFTIAL